MKLVDVYSLSSSPAVLYRLLAERPIENHISHEKMPAQVEHMAFMLSRPFRYWYLIEANDTHVGALEVTDLNEIGVAIFKEHQRKGYASAALRLFLATHQPLPPVKAMRNGRWLANVATYNHASHMFWQKHGFTAIQVTYAK